MANPYERGNTATLAGGAEFYAVDISSADHTFADLPRAIIVGNTGTTIQTLAVRAEGATADVNLVCGPGSTLFPLAPEIIRQSANLSVVAFG